MASASGEDHIAAKEVLLDAKAHVPVRVACPQGMVRADEIPVGVFEEVLELRLHEETRQLARENNVDLSKVVGTGPNGVDNSSI